MDELPDALELLFVQQGQPAPRQQPAPLNQDALRGYGEQRQQPRPQQRQPMPTPMPAPMSAPAQAAPPMQQQQADELPDALDIIGGNVGAQPGQRQPMPRPGSRLGTFRGDRVREAIVGKQDPRYQGIPNVASVIQQRGQSFGEIGREMGGWAVGSSDADMGKAYAGMLGDRYVRTEKDANGYPVVIYRDDKGKEAAAYVNSPGLDTQDVVRGVTGALPFAKAGQLISGMTQASPLFGRVGAQTLGQAATSVAQDATGLATGASSPSDGDIAIKAGVAGAGGAAGEFIVAAFSPIVRKVWTEPKYLNRATGELTEEGARLAREAGIDPLDLTRQVAKEFAEAVAKGADPEAAFRQAGSREFGIRRSAGELSGDKGQLLREQQMRGTTYGNQAAEMVKAFDTTQGDDIVRATRGVNPRPAAPAMVERLAPERATQAMQMSQMDTGRNIAGNTSRAFEAAKAGEKEAWKAVPPLKADEGMRSTLPQYLNRSIKEFPVPPGGAAEMMERSLDDFIAGQKPKAASSWRTADPTGDAVEFRKYLGRIQRSIQDPTEAAAAKAMMRGYDDWLDETAVAMFPTDPIAAARYKTARGLTRDLHAVFDGQKGSPGAQVMKSIMQTTDSAEGIVNALFNGPTAQIKNGTMSGLQSLKRAYDTYLPKAEAKAAWDDIRLAYWLKVTSDKGNAVKNPAALSSAIKSMMGTQGSVARSLYTPPELAAMKRLAITMDDIKRKNPNTSWSAIGVGALMKDGFNALLKTIGFDSVLGKTAATLVGGPVIRSYGSVQASRATGGLQGAALPTVRTPTRVGTNRLYLELPPTSGIGGALGSQSNQ